MSRTETRLDRRKFLEQLVTRGLGFSVAIPSVLCAAEVQSRAFVPTRAITCGPKHHWFGYYDKLQFGPSDRLVLANQVDFEHRSPAPEDVIRVGMIDLVQGDRWVHLGTSRAWGWQQGCMLQWRPGSQHEILWNDRDGDRFVCRVLDLKSNQTRTLARPIYTLSPEGTWGLSVDFARINNLRPGYGYAGVRDPHVDEKAPADSGIWRIDLKNGDSELIVSIEEMAAVPHQGKSLRQAWNYFNHLLVSTDGSRFAFLHRWRHAYDPNKREGSRFVTRMITANADGTDRFIIDPSGYTSHFVWRDPAHICAWTRPAQQPPAFYLLHDRTGRTSPVGSDVMTENGHITYVPRTENQWILNDTYPRGEGRFQVPYLYHVPSHRRFDLGHFHAPAGYQGEWRCDTHPRCSNDGRRVSIDSPHGCHGRQVYLLDIGEILDRP